MSSPSYRDDSLRRRVAEGRARREAKARRVYATIQVTKRTLAVTAGVAVVAAGLAVTSIASATTGADETNDTGTLAVSTLNCPTVADQLPEIPAAAQADVDRELAALETQIDEANNRLVATQGQGGPNFVQNAILGPLADKRFAVLNRIEIAIGRHAEPPSGLTDLAVCGLNENGGDAGGDQDGGDQDGNDQDGNDQDGDDPGSDPGGDPGGDDHGDHGGGDPGNGNSGVNTVGPLGVNGDNNGLDLLGRDCTAINLPIHTGFQSEEAQCVQTQSGAVSALENNPSLLITEHPISVAAGEPFSYTVGTRNLRRDRFLGAGAGGYYAESDFLDENGIARGHFHNACLNIGDGLEVPTPESLADPQFFLAVEDGGGGAGQDFVTVTVEDGLPEPGQYRCMAWAGGPSHRMPMMTFARQQIAVDIFRLEVTE